MGAIRVGRWDCRQCDFKGNLGPELHCTRCGSPRPGDVRFYLPEDAEVVTDAARLEEALAGPDWVCSHCEAHNKARYAHCSACGNANGDPEDRSLKKKEYGPGEAPATGAQAAEAEQAESAQAEPIQPESTAGGQASSLNLMTGCLFPIGKLLAYVLELFIFVMVLGFCYATLIDRADEVPFKALWPHMEATSKRMQAIEHRVDGLRFEAPLEIVEYRWERKVRLERSTLVEKKGDSLPAGAEKIGEERVIASTEQIPDGFVPDTRDVQVQTGTRTAKRTTSKQVQTGSEQYKCGTVDMGNGYFQDKMCDRPIYTTQTVEESYEEPVYETRQESYQRQLYREVHTYKSVYRYRVPEWHPDTPGVTSGVGREPVWYSAHLGDPRRRETGREERYTVKFRTFDGVPVEEELPLARWKALPGPGEKLMVTVEALSSSTPSLKEPGKEEVSP